MTFKKGDKVEYRGGVWVFKEYYDILKDSCYITYGKVIMYAFITEVKPIKSAHDKLIEMGYTCIKDDDCKVIFENGDDTVEFDKRLKGCNVFNYESDNVFIESELIKIMAQYLEEMEEIK